MTTLNIPGEVTVRVFEGSRVKNVNLFQKQSTYVKVKHNGQKTRTLANVGGTAPRWTVKDNNTLTMPVHSVDAEISVELWNQTQHKKNAKIDAVSVPVEPYARQEGPPTPKWHRLSNQGSLLFSVEFTPSPGAEAKMKNLDKISPKRAFDPSTVEEIQKYHDAGDRDEVQFGDIIALHALGERFVKLGSCMRTHLQKGKKCLQLTKTFDSSSQFRIGGAETSGEPITYGTRFHLEEMKTGQRVMIGTGMFQFVPVNTNGDIIMNSPVHFGHSMYLQAIYAKHGALNLGCEGESLHVFDPTIYVSPHTPKVTFTLTYDDGLVKAPQDKPTTILDFNLTTYNVWMMPDKITKFADVSPMKCERAQLIPGALPVSDAVIFNEAFCHVARPVLLEAMKEQGYYYETPVVGHLVGRAQAKFLDGGVVLVSKYPIETADVMRFGGVCHGDDALADKGVVYARIRKQGRAVHIFASHTQAWTDTAAVKMRQDQFRMMRNFMDEKGIPSNEPILVAGDFNVNSLVNKDNGEYTEMINILECNEPDNEIDQQNEASFDADNNPLAADGPSSDGVCERLDFILSCQHHLLPTSSEVKVCPIKSTDSWTWGKKGNFHDLSDHYPVTSKFSYNFE